MELTAAGLYRTFTCFPFHCSNVQTTSTGAKVRKNTHIQRSTHKKLGVPNATSITVRPIRVFNDYSLRNLFEALQNRENESCREEADANKYTPDDGEIHTPHKTGNHD